MFGINSRQAEEGAKRDVALRANRKQAQGSKLLRSKHVSNVENRENLKQILVFFA